MLIGLPQKPRGTFVGISVNASAIRHWTVVTGFFFVSIDYEQAFCILLEQRVTLLTIIVSRS
jgi:hypothetical protein